MSELKRILRMAERQVALLEEIAKVEAHLKSLQEELRVLSENDLPEAMSIEGLESFSMKDGKKVAIAVSYHSSISSTNQHAAFSWLRENQFDGIIKRNITAKFGRGEDKLAEKVSGHIVKKFPHLDLEDKSSVHHSTLKSFVKERIESGEDFPMDLFSVFIRQFTVIK
ncbi:MAG: hypothetical protein WDA12_05090 [Bacilli bacterium]